MHSIRSENWDLVRCDDLWPRFTTPSPSRLGTHFAGKPHMSMNSDFQSSVLWTRPIGLARAMSDNMAHILAFCSSVRVDSRTFTRASSGACSIRSEERRVGDGCDSTGRSRGSQGVYKKK